MLRFVMIYRYLLVIFALLGLVLVVACSGGTVPSTSVPTQVTVPTTAPTQAVAPTSQVTVPTTAPTQAVAPTSQVTAPTTAPTQPVAPTSQVTAPTAAPTAAPLTSATAVPTSKPGTFGRAEVDKIFPPGKGQDLVFQACVNCHNWVPLVLAGFDQNGWAQNKLNHRNRVSSLSDADFEYLYQYLVQTFPAGHPVPTNIPEDLLKEWTSY
jgi:hypothetical protein